MKATGEREYNKIFLEVSSVIDYLIIILCPLTGSSCGPTTIVASTVYLQLPLEIFASLVIES